MISPCECKGEGKYVCKECLNKYMSIDKTDVKYNICPTCKTHYKRDVPDILNYVSHEVTNELMLGVSIIFFICASFLLMGKNPSILYFLLFIIYIVTLYNLKIWSYGIGPMILFLFLYVNNSNFKEAYPLYCFWTLGLFSLLACRLLDNGYHSLFNYKYDKLVERLGCKMYDNDLMQYVSGVM